MSTAICLTQEQIELLAQGELTAENAARARGHLGACPGCHDRYRRLLDNQAFLNRMRGLLEPDNAAGLEPTLTSVERLAGEPPGNVSNDVFPVERIEGYDLLREIHRGGQGAVYEALQHSTRRTVAIKLLHGGSLASERSRWRFEREVKLVASLRHPNIVVVHDSGIDHGRYYFAMDHVKGRPLDVHSRAMNLSVHERVAMVLPICDAIACAHRRGVIHRDLKPSNILVDEEGKPCVVDFGLAKELGEDVGAAGDAPVSVVGNVMGTLPYMSPEQTRGDPEAVDTRTDIYSLGVILYELLTQQQPYRTGADLHEAIRNIRNVDPPRPSRHCKGIAADLDVIVLKALEKDPARRYQSAGELRADLAAWLEGAPISARSNSSLYVLGKLAAQHSFETTVIFTVLAILIGFSVSVAYLHREQRGENRAFKLMNQRLERQIRDLQENAHAARAAITRQQLWRFLFAWRAGLDERARSVYEAMDPTLPEQAVMGFLLDEHAASEDLLDHLGPDHASLGRFAAGERALRSGKKAEAAAHFAAALDAPDRRLWREAHARLDQLRSVGADGELPGERAAAE